MTVMTVLRSRPDAGGGTDTRDDRVIEQLRYVTRPYCIQLDRHERLVRHATRADQVETLELLLGFYRPIDRWIAAALAPVRNELALQRRAKAPLIAQKLSDLGAKFTALRFHPAPLRSGMSYALGWLYGIEVAAIGSPFFDGYGADTHDMWERLSSVLAQRIAGDTECAAAREGAVDMLAALDDWMSLEALPR